MTLEITLIFSPIRKKQKQNQNQNKNKNKNKNKDKNKNKNKNKKKPKQNKKTIGNHTDKIDIFTMETTLIIQIIQDNHIDIFSIVVQGHWNCTEKF